MATDRADEFPHPYVTVDLLLFTVPEQRDEVVAPLRLVVTRRRRKPAGWVLPGAFVGVDEHTDDTARRVLAEKVGLAGVPSFLAIRPFGDPSRDERRRVITLPHVALVDLDRLGSEASMASDVRVATVRLDERADPQVLVEEAPVSLRFDHDAIVAAAVRELQRRVRSLDPEVHAQLLPDRFTFRRLWEVHQAVLGQRVDLNSFRRRVRATGAVTATGERQQDVSHRPAQLHRFEI